MLTMEPLGNSLDKPKFEIMIVQEDKAYDFKPDVERLLKGRTFNAPVLYSIDQAIEMVSTGRMQLWMIRERGKTKPCLFMLTEILEYPAGRTINLCLTAGSNLFPAAKQLFNLFLIWAMRRNVDFIECTTKPGVVRMLKRFGFEVTGIKLHYPLRTVQ